jgi:hypothetical protein
VDRFHVRCCLSRVGYAPRSNGSRAEQQGPSLVDRDLARVPRSPDWPREG